MTFVMIATKRVTIKEVKFLLLRNHMNFQGNGALNVAQGFTKSRHILLSFSPLVTVRPRVLWGCSTSEDKVDKTTNFC